MAWFKKKQDPISERARELKKQIAEIEGQIRKLSVQQAKAESHWETKDGLSSLNSVAPPQESGLPTAKANPPRDPRGASGEKSKSSFPSAIPPVPPAPAKRVRPTPPAPPAAPAPKLRSTTRPQSPTLFLPKAESPADAGSATHDDPIFEEVGQNPFRGEAGPVRPKDRNHLDIRRNDLVSMWRRFKTNFRGPATSNPKLVNYLAAGSIQGLRPLRYERRVARNRFLVLVVVLILVLWGIVALIFFR